MGDPQGSVGIKRQATPNTPESEPKQPRIDVDDDTTIDGLNLTNLIDDFLEQIFRYLDPVDFVSIAHTSKQLKSAADMAFKRKFGKMEIILDKRARFFDTKSSTIRITDIKTSLRLLRCFGHLITKLTVKHSRDFCPKLISYSSEYSFNSLSVIRIYRSFIKNDLLIKPFAKVKEVEFFVCGLSLDMDLNKWFPAIRRLDLIECSLANKLFIVKNLPHLEYLEFSDYRHIPAEQVLRCIHQNPQLRTLLLAGVKVSEQFWSTCQLLSRLECLSIHDYFDDLFPTPVDTAAKLNAPKKLEISFRNENDLRVMTSQISFNHLTDITLNFGWVRLVTTFQWSKFFKKHQSIEKVTLGLRDNGNVNIDESIVNEIALELPGLKEFNNFACYSSIPRVLRFMAKFKLMSYGFTLKNEFEFDELKGRLGIEWHTSINSTRVKVNRKM